MPQVKLPISEAYFTANIASTTAGNLKPWHIKQIAELLKRKVNAHQADYLNGANESTLATIFGDGLN